MSHFFVASSSARRSIAAFALALLAGAAQAEERNPLQAVTDAIGLTAPSGERPDFVRESRPDEKSMNFIPFVGPEKKRIPLKTPEQAAADDAALTAAKTQAQGRLKKLQSENVEAPPAATKPPPVTDKF